MSEKLDGLLTTTDVAVVELEELRGIISEGQERGFLTAEALAAVVEDAELSGEQTQDLFSYLEEHGIDVVGAPHSAPGLELHPGAGDDSAASQQADPVAVAATHSEPPAGPGEIGEGDAHGGGLRARSSRSSSARRST